MLPDFLSKFQAQLESYRLDYLKITAQPLRRNQSLTLTQSKFLGTPFMPLGMPYPRDEKGKPMILLAQINFAETPALNDYPTEGILQLFVSPTEWYNMEDYRILFHPDTTGEPQLDFAFLTSDLYSDSPIRVEHSLTFSKETEYGGTEDGRFDMDFDGMSYYDYQETLPKEQQDQLDRYFYNVGHKIGGYAYFTQADPRDYSPGKEE